MNGTKRLAGKIILLLTFVLAASSILRSGSASATSRYLCNQIIGFSQTHDWYGGFESVVDQTHWEILWQNGATIDLWANPNYFGWNGAPESPCTTNSKNPDRVVLTIGGREESNVDWWVEQINKTIDNIRAKYPNVQQIDLQPTVGGPNHNICYIEGDSVRASKNHPVIDDAITQVIGGDVVLGDSPEVRTCVDYADRIGHLTFSSRDPIGKEIGAYYEPTNSPTPTLTPTITPTPTTGPSATPTPTAAPSATPTVTPTPAPTSATTPTPTPTPFWCKDFPQFC